MRKLLEDNREGWALTVAVPPREDAGWRRNIPVSDVNRPGLALAGYFGYFAWSRVQVFGKTEMSYLRRLGSRARGIMERIFSYRVPCAVVTRSLPLPQVLVEAAARTSAPVLRTPLMTTRFMSVLTTYLENQLAPTVWRHGSLVDVFGTGVLLSGKSGIGKSECALALVKRGHRFVADDVVKIRRQAGSVLMGTCDEHLEQRVELRGIGILDMRALFGATAVSLQKEIDLVAQMEEWRPGREFDRLGLEDAREDILEVPVPKVTVPVRPGRDSALAVEAAAVNERAKRMGVYSAREFEARMLDRIGRRRA